MDSVEVLLLEGQVVAQQLALFVGGHEVDERLLEQRDGLLVLAALVGFHAATVGFLRAVKV